MRMRSCVVSSPLQGMATALQSRSSRSTSRSHACWSCFTNTRRRASKPSSKALHSSKSCWTWCVVSACAWTRCPKPWRSRRTRKMRSRRPTSSSRSGRSNTTNRIISISQAGRSRGTRKRHISSTRGSSSRGKRSRKSRQHLLCSIRMLSLQGQRSRGARMLREQHCHPSQHQWQVSNTLAHLPLRARQACLRTQHLGILRGEMRWTRCARSCALCAQYWSREATSAV
mmetsp:Transcript_25131/g.64894  ORF Transcript_25131/g.64894 Transcript_25131/m.64894 type:complete len:228 (+) Transcript_25131:1224-1907(+)